MTNNYEKTKKAVLLAVKERAEQTRPTRVFIPKGAKTLGQFLQNCLTQREMSRVTFAQLLDMETELTDAILDGVLPESELHAELLEELAEAAGCQFSQLQQALRGDISAPTNVNGLISGV
jgi:hypothetical protein